MCSEAHFARECLECNIALPRGPPLQALLSSVLLLNLLIAMMGFTFHHIWHTAELSARPARPHGI